MSKLPRNIKPQQLIKFLIKLGFNKGKGRGRDVRQNHQTSRINRERPEEFEVNMYKIVTFVPLNKAQKVRMAMGNAGAGANGNYSHASFSSRGIGRFKPLPGAHPAIGRIGKLEEVEEEKIEVICEKEKVKGVVAAIKTTHPYEDILIEVWPVLVRDDL